jgi:peptidoglycan/LPS O-acetylase OafA/YrhL
VDFNPKGGDSDGRSNAYYPQLDGVRATAVCAVLIGHLIPLRVLQASVGWGDMGVVLFFCLSGFLISGILLGVKSRLERTKLAGLKSFYIRRALRIAPIYYLTIAVALLVGYPPALAHAFRLVTYSLNLPGLAPSDNLGALSHFWSLSVEEQFYLFWPVAVLFVPQHLLPRLVSALVGLSLLYKISFALGGAPYKTIFFRIPGCIDSLGLGSLLALQYDRSKSPAKTLHAFVSIGKIFGCLWITMTFLRLTLGIDPYYMGHLVFGVLYFFVSALAFTGFIAYAVSDSKGLIGRALENTWMVRIGKISYGLYVYHFVMPYVLAWVAKKGFRPIQSPWGLAVLSLFLSFIAADLSWRFIEGPVLRLKRHFHY